MFKYRKLELARIFVFVAYVVTVLGLPFYGFMRLVNWMLKTYPVYTGHPVVSGFLLIFSLIGYTVIYGLWVLCALAIFGYATQED